MSGGGDGYGTRACDLCRVCSPTVCHALSLSLRFMTRTHVHMRDTASHPYAHVRMDAHTHTRHARACAPAHLRGESRAGQYSNPQGTAPAPAARKYRKSGMTSRRQSQPRPPRPRLHRPTCCAAVGIRWCVATTGNHLVNTPTVSPDNDARRCGVAAEVVASCFLSASICGCTRRLARAATPPVQHVRYPKHAGNHRHTRGARGPLLRSSRSTR